MGTLTIVPHKQQVCPWGTTYRIHEDGVPLKTRCGCRVRAWSTHDAAQAEIDRVTGARLRGADNAR